MNRVSVADAPEKATSEWWLEWIKSYGANIEVLDPDGWDRTDFEYSFEKEQIGFGEFVMRLGLSTCRWGPPTKEVEGTVLYTAPERFAHTNTWDIIDTLERRWARFKKEKEMAKA